MSTEAEATEKESTEEVPVVEKVQSGLSEMSEVDVDDFSKEDLVMLAEEFNEDRGLKQTDPAYVKTSGTKSDIFGQLQQHEEVLKDLDNLQHGHEAREIPLGQIEVNPHNYRHSIDYEDPSLQDKIRKEGGLIDAVTVRDSGETDDDGNTIFWPVSGNRSVFNLRRVLLEAGMDENEVDAYSVNCVVREVEGAKDDTERKVDEILAIMSANESQRKQSPTDKFRAYRDLQREGGLSMTEIGEETGNSPQYVSKVLRLRHLPERIRELVHFSYNADELGELSAEQLDNAKVPYLKDEDGNPVRNEEGKIAVQGITWNNALVAASMARRVEREADEEDKEQKLMDFEDLLLDASKEFRYKGDKYDTGVIGAAKIMSETTFESMLNSWTKEAEILEGYDQVEKQGEAGKDSGSTTTNDEGVETEEVEASSTEEESEVEVEETDSDDFDIYEFADSLQVGEFELDSDWEETFADQLRMGSAKAKRAAKWMLEEGIFIEA